eukprot:Amastigsp_a509385_45.p5 type:complete len:140 gc:universal Amastigsp_a509385_45:916-497(-)
MYPPPVSSALSTGLPKRSRSRVQKCIGEQNSRYIPQTNSISGSHFSSGSSGEVTSATSSSRHDESASSPSTSRITDISSHSRQRTEVRAAVSDLANGPKHEKYTLIHGIASTTTPVPWYWPRIAVRNPLTTSSAEDSRT